MNQLNELAELAAKYVNSTQRHIFLTGKAGTGKTTFLRYIVGNTYKKAVVAAPTGVAAINAGGVTLHSLFQLPFGSFIPENISLPPSNSLVNTPQTLHRESKFNTNKRQLIQELELLIIDEVSMLRADLLDCIDQTLRFIRRNRSTPFGGVQILFIGDLLQLPPVIKESEIELLKPFYSSSYFFHARALADNPPIKVELQHIYRQSEQHFIDLLNRLRNNQQTVEDIHLLNSHFDETAAAQPQEGYIHLTTHNRKANKINEDRLLKLDGHEYAFEAYVEGEFPENMYPAVANLRLKEGAQVMFIKNDPSGQGKFYNGKIGVVSNIAYGDIKVKFEDGEETNVEKYTWENKRYSLSKITGEIVEKSLGTFEQFPIKLAWAVTIHKCQGLTFEKAILDLSQTFAPGQLYVALSRLTSMDGLVLSSPISDKLPAIDDHLYEFVNSFPDENELHGNLENDRRIFIQKFTESAYGFESLIRELRFHEKSFNKDEKRSLKQQFLPWTQALISQTIELDTIGKKFFNQVARLCNQEDYLSSIHERISKAESYFLPRLKELSTKIKAHREAIGNEKKVKSYVEELKDLESRFDYQEKQIRKLTLFIDHAAQNKILTKSQLLKADLYKTPSSGTKSKKGKRKDKIPSAKISLEMYNDGKQIEEIAKSRGLVRSTIESHLTKYIEAGELDVFQLVDKSKVEKVIKLFNEGNQRGGEIKYQLGDDYSYGEVRMAVAHARWLESNGN